MHNANLYHTHTIFRTWMGISSAKTTPTCQLLCSKIREPTTLVKPIPCQGGEQCEILAMSEGTTDATRQLSPHAFPPTGDPGGQAGTAPAPPPSTPARNSPAPATERKQKSRLYLLCLLVLTRAVILAWLSSVRTVVKGVLYHSCDKNKTKPTKKPAKGSPVG